jgi:hypothetical protein
MQGTKITLAAIWEVENWASPKRVKLISHRDEGKQQVKEKAEAMFASGC